MQKNIVMVKNSQKCDTGEESREVPEEEISVLFSLFFFN